MAERRKRERYEDETGECKYPIAVMNTLLADKIPIDLNAEPSVPKRARTSDQHGSQAPALSDRSNIQVCSSLERTFLLILRCRIKGLLLYL